MADLVFVVFEGLKFSKNKKTVQNLIEIWSEMR